MTDLVKRLRLSYEGIPLCVKCAEGADEIERLQRALHDIAKGATVDEVPLDQEPSMFRLAMWRWSQERAREALKGEEDAPNSL